MNASSESGLCATVMRVSVIGPLAGGKGHRIQPEGYRNLSGCTSSLASNSTASATRGPGTQIRESTMSRRPSFRTAGTEGTPARWSDRATGWRSRANCRDLENDVRLAREDQLGAGLHRFALDVGEHVVAAGRVEHVVQETDAAARVDAAQRSRSRPKTSSVRRPPVRLHALPDAVEPRFDAERATAALQQSWPERRAELAAAWPIMSARPAWRYETPDAARVELLLQIHLAAVDRRPDPASARGSARRSGRAARPTRSAVLHLGRVAS